MALASVRRAMAAAAQSGRIGVIDVGSNSIRLVVYDRLARAPQPIFNERVLCGLGRGLARTGRLHPDGRERALENIARFVVLARHMGVGRLDILATAHLSVTQVTRSSRVFGFRTNGAFAVRTKPSIHGRGGSD